MTTTLTRSTNAISDFVRASRRAAALGMQLKQAQQEMESLKDSVLDQIGGSRTVKVDGAVATLTPRVSQSVKMRDKHAALEFWRSHGLKISVQEPEYVASASFRSEVLKGSVPEELYDLTQDVDVNVI